MPPTPQTDRTSIGSAETAQPWRARLRALPTFDADIPGFEPDDAPEEPDALFAEWLDAAIVAGARMPHAATLSTADGEGEVSARTLILKDLDAEGWWFASRTDGRKARDLAARPRAAMTFLWREQGRQVRVRGSVEDAGRAAADADFLARPVHSRAAAIVGTQSAPLGSRDEYTAAFESAKAEIERAPEATSPTWSAFVLRPLEVEFWAATPTSGQVRLAYRRDGLDTPWRRMLLWP